MGEKCLSFHTVNERSWFFFVRSFTAAALLCNFFLREIISGFACKISWTQCGECGNLHAILAKKFVKVTYLTKKLLKSWFDEIFYHTVLQILNSNYMKLQFFYMKSIYLDFPCDRFWFLNFTFTVQCWHYGMFSHAFLAIMSWR